jgi:putative MATE family efflux protein
MNDETTKYDPLTGNVTSVFLRYAIPEIGAMLALSSAGLIDAIFLGNFVGVEALAAVNLSIPVWSLIFGLGLMISVGGSVVCGKYLGEKNDQLANEIFTKTVLVTLVISLLFSLLLNLALIDQLVGALGATNARLAAPLGTYLTILLWFTPFMMLQLVFFYFVRLDGQPVLAAVATLVGAIVNIFLDWLLIVHLEMGIMGAAFATAMSAVLASMILFPHFFTRRSRLKFSGPLTDWLGLVKAYVNGVSEFANEASVAVTTFIFNWVMVTRMGVEGVAALTIVDYLLMAGIMISYGISDSLQPIISQNFGARNERRIMEFLRIAAFSIGAVSVAMILIIVSIPEILTRVFLKPDEVETARIATQFLIFLWPAFLFNGLNILASAYLTSMQKPMQSAFIGLSRGFALPAAFLLMLPMWLGDTGIYLSLPLAEAVAFAASLLFFMQNTPSRVIQAERRSS